MIGARVIVLAVLASAVAACDTKQAQIERQQRAAEAAKRKQECAAMTTAIATMRLRGRTDIVETDTSCWTIDTENCRIKVEMALELRSAGNPTLADQVMPIGKDCSGEAQFESKYELAAFRDHRKLLEQAEQDATDEALANGTEEPMERDPPE